MPPTMLRFTAAGAALLADQQNRGIRPVRFLRLETGSGSGPGGAADDGRTTLRTPRDAGGLLAAPPAAGRISVVARIAASGAYRVTEVGLWGRVGDDGPETLVAYWTDGGRAIAAAAEAGAVIDLGGAIDLQASAADVQVKLGRNIKGDKGDKGDRGPRGPKGDKGDKGLKGEKGERGDLNSGLTALADAAAIAWDLAAAPNAQVVLGGNRTMNAPTSAVDGGYYLLTVQQDAAGARTLAWNAAYVFTGVGFRGAPTLASAAGARTKFAFVREGGGMRCLGRVTGF